MTTSAGWRAVLEGAHAERARIVLDEIAERLERTPANGPGLVDGAGRALLFARLNRDDVAEALVGTSVASAELRGPSLFTGVAGVAFVLAQLGGEVDDTIDAGLAATLQPTDHHDLLRGVSGIGVYALERMPQTVALLGRVIEWLSDRAVRAPAGRYLFSPPGSLGPRARQEFPQGAIDLGVAHGQGAAIVVAGGATAWGVPGARALYEDLVAYLWTQASDGGPCFRSMVGSSAARAAWCYGDPGIAAALLTAADAAGDDTSRRRAIELARAAARWVVPDDVTDAHVCHGAFGLAHVFNRIAQAARDDELAAASRAWYDRALSFPRPDELDLLEGELGVALTLSSAITEHEPVWDRALAVSVARPPAP